MKELSKKYVLIVKAAVLIAIYAFITYNYLSFKVCKERGSYLWLSIFYIFIIFMMLHHIALQKKKLIQVCNIIEVVLVPLSSVFVIEIMCNPLINNLKTIYILCNYIIILVIELLFVSLFGYKKGLYSVSSLALLFGTINFFVLKFKGTPFMPTDIIAIKTAMNVSGHYDFSVNQTFITAFIIYMLEICIIKYIGENEICKTKRTLIWRTFIFFSLLFTSTFLTSFNYLKEFNLALNGWTLAATYYEYGSPFAFLLETQQLNCDKPQGYSLTKATKLLESYNFTVSAGTVTPNIIIIMNESFSDLSILGDIDTSNYLQNWNNADYIMRGYAYSSVYGGGTCNSEFEMLTGSTMAFIPGGGVYPYQNFNLKNAENIVEVFKENGYSTTALHPANAGNWNRDKVYDHFGFDEFFSNKDFNNPKYYHTYISDQSVYDKIIELLETQTMPKFIFGITMQNHGGYNLDTLENTELVNIEDSYSKYEQAITFMTLIHESDIAFQSLYNYVMNYNEPTIVCMFGDHQPKLDSDFINYLKSTDTTKTSKLEETMNTYAVPYIIYSNYDMDKKQIEKDLSINYLGSTILELAGYSTPYFEFIRNIEESIPILNVKGYKTNDNIWHEISESNEQLENYKIVQYYNLFDKKNT